MRMQLIRTLGRWIHEYKHRIGLIAVGHTFKQLEEFIWDWVVYGAIVAYTTTQFGPLWGAWYTFLVMMPFVVIFEYLYIRFYDWSGRDWLGLELLKEFRDEIKQEHWFGRLLHRLLRCGSAPAFVILSIHAGAFMTTVYFRPKHRQYAGLTQRDWFIFCTSAIFSNAYWTLQWVLIVEVIKAIWSYIILPYSIFFG